MLPGTAPQLWADVAITLEPTAHSGDPQKGCIAVTQDTEWWR